MTGLRDGEGAWESNPPGRLVTPHNSFEDCTSRRTLPRNNRAEPIAVATVSPTVRAREFFNHLGRRTCIDDFGCPETLLVVEGNKFRPKVVRNRDVDGVGASESVVCRDVGSDLREPEVERDESHVGQLGECRDHNPGADGVAPRASNRTSYLGQQQDWLDDRQLGFSQKFKELLAFGECRIASVNGARENAGVKGVHLVVESLAP